MIPGRNGRVEELEKQLNEMVANQKRLESPIMELKTEMRNQKIKTMHLEIMLHACVRVVNARSDRRREATSCGLRTSLEVKLNKDSEREESEAPLRGQKKSKDQKSHHLRNLFRIFKEHTPE